MIPIITIGLGYAQETQPPQAVMPRGKPVVIALG